MKRTEETIGELKNLDEKVTRLGHIAALLEWDQETYLPPDAVEERASQIALIVGLHHESIVDEEWAALFTKLGLQRRCSPVRSGRNRFRLPPGNLQAMEQKDPGSQRSLLKISPEKPPYPRTPGPEPANRTTSVRLHPILRG